MDMDQRESISKLILLTQKKEGYLEEMLRLTAVQKVLIKDGEIEKLTEVIDHKQKLIEAIQEVDIKFLKHYT